jgi:hypothetical protein
MKKNEREEKRAIVAVAVFVWFVSVSQRLDAREKTDSIYKHLRPQRTFRTFRRFRDDDDGRALSLFRRPAHRSNNNQHHQGLAIQVSPATTTKHSYNHYCTTTTSVHTLLLYVPKRRVTEFCWMLLVYR